MSADVPLVFLDTETTGVHAILDGVWEVGAIRREIDGTETEHQWFIRHDGYGYRTESLPESFRADYRARYDAAAALTIRQTRERITHLFRGGAHLVGANPAFDAAMLGNAFDTAGDPERTPAGDSRPWHHHLVDVYALAAGALGWPQFWNAHDLSAALGVAELPGRHTALVDARWARDLYDVVVEGGLERVTFPVREFGLGDRVLVDPTSGDLPWIGAVVGKIWGPAGLLQHRVGPVLEPDDAERQYTAARHELHQLKPWPVPHAE